MNIRLLYVVVISIFSTLLHAQLSPGELSSAHKALEGISNCTQCHDLGKKVSNQKCLDCHKEIKSRVDKNKGFHVSATVKGKDCASCHSDHHGRNFDMVRFDEKTFDHQNQAGYALTGKHAKVDCRACHKPDYIADTEIKKRRDSFLGMPTDCAACHKDAHQTTLGNDCAKCHNNDQFKPATKFNHDKTAFVLSGKHKTVDCLECHPKESRNGADFQKFKGVAFKNCNSCHQDPHHNQLGANCKECHSEQSFTAHNQLPKFNHAKTDFPLKGKHKTVNCASCHALDIGVLKVFQDKKGIPTNDCVACHKDVHEGKFGTHCADCHNEDGFRKVGNMEGFDHQRTDFPLKGKHTAVDCRKCHTTGHFTEPLPHNTCATCHNDYHEQQFAVNGKSPDCAQCHTVDGFQFSLFELEQHQKTKFPLEGAHQATPCLACHQKQEKWSFRQIGERCVDCHKDIHVSQIDPKWYPQQDCAICHQPQEWAAAGFDHSKTNFALAGKHAEQPCRNCHKPDDTHPQGVFAGLSKQCQDCHQDTHYKQFEIKGVTDCARCHKTAEMWTIKRFDHHKSRFKLDGKHATVPCKDCHKPVTDTEKTYVQYKFASIECVVCHK